VVVNLASLLVEVEVSDAPAKQAAGQEPEPEKVSSTGRSPGDEILSDV
jgi:hypothetical protein